MIESKLTLAERSAGLRASIADYAAEHYPAETVVSLRELLETGDDSYADDIEAGRSVLLDVFKTRTGSTLITKLRGDEELLRALTSLSGFRLQYMAEPRTLRQIVSGSEDPAKTEFEILHEINGIIEGLIAKGEVKEPANSSDTGKDVSVGGLAKNARLRRQQAEMERKNIDPFMDALRPPQDWLINRPFQEKFDATISHVIDQAVRETRLSDTNGFVIKTRLGLVSGVSQQVEQFIGLENPLEYLSSLASVHPGRLVHAKTDERVKAMETTVTMFARQRMPVDQIVKKFGGDPLAKLFVKGAVAEVLMASTRAAQVDKKRPHQHD